LWNPKTGKLIRELTKPEEPCPYLAFSPDGKQIVTAGHTPAIRFWDVATGKETKPSNGHTSPIFSLAFSPKDNLLASRSGDHTVRLWDVGKRTTMRTLSLTPDSPPSGPGPFSSFAAGLSFSHDGSLLAAAGIWQVDIPVKARVWEVSSGKEVAALGKHFRYVPNGIAFMPDGKSVVTAGYGGSRLHALPDGKEVPSFFGPVTETRSETSDQCVAVSPDGRLLVMGNSRDVLRFLDARTGKLLREIPTGLRGAHNAVFSPDGRILATGGGRLPHRVAKQFIQLWEVATCKPLAIIGSGKEHFYSFAFSPDGRLIATADHKDHRVRVWNVFTGKEVARFDGHTADVYCVAFSPDGKFLASAGADSTILLWDTSKLDGRLSAAAAAPKNWIAAGRSFAVPTSPMPSGASTCSSRPAMMPWR
jgi:WD40 repeat protein